MIVRWGDLQTDGLSKVICAVAFVVGLVLIDQLVKYWVLEALDTDQVVSLLPWLHLYRVWNSGVAFSLFASQDSTAVMLLLLITGGLLMALWGYCLQMLVYSKNLHRTMVLLLLCAGGFANWIDRVMYGAVLDYIYLHYSGWYWPTIFNLADVYISIGCVYYLYVACFHVEPAAIRVLSSKSAT